MVTSQTLTQRVPVGATDLKQAFIIDASSIGPGDRVLIALLGTALEGTAEARRILVMSSADVSNRQETDRQDWIDRGIAGIVKTRSDAELIVKLRNSGAETKVRVDEKTKVRRYSRESVQYGDAVPGNVVEVREGDQLRARGSKGPDGTLVAEELIYGSFVSVAGSVTAVDLNNRTVTIQQLGSNVPRLLSVPSKTQIKKMPVAPIPGGGAPSQGRGPAPGAFGRGGAPGGPPSPPDLNQLIERLPLGDLPDVQVGQTIVAAISEGAENSPSTAVVLIANASALLMMSRQGPGGSALPPRDTGGPGFGGLGAGLDLLGIFP
jgi:hypothetical protein